MHCPTCRLVCLCRDGSCVLRLWGGAEVPKLDTQVLDSLARKDAVSLVSTVYLV